MDASTPTSRADDEWRQWREWQADQDAQTWCHENREALAVADRMFTAYNAILDADPEWREIEAQIQDLKARAKPFEQRAAALTRKVMGC